MQNLFRLISPLIVNVNLSFDLDDEFTDDYQINLVVEDKQRQHAVFVTESLHGNNSRNISTIDSVTLMKMVLGANDKLSF